MIPYARNARLHTDAQVAQIAASIREWGWTMPVLVDEAGTLIAGHGRVLAARVLNIDQIPTMIAAGWTENQVKAYRIADNKLALNAGWDDQMLGVEFAALRDFGVDLTLTGFDALSVHELIVASGAVEATTRLPPLPDGERNPFQAMTFVLHDDQVETVKAAMAQAKQQGEFDGPNENSNGNALARICEAYTDGC